ncbi:putative lipase atg15 [Zancudomyces culisetae]|uniref:triacylglycerol lipase n=1 Tax=Zancudomyces culisetae TaxID=1213189 RepID=A0A1R1PS57_ZANCU|nr:putative lipase atg15 [Zancudomyces culisetae]|eukprot:OMH83722.1 putative lipase atg15 [Zancudomyces culisetae]
MRQKYLASKHGIQKSYWKTEIKKKTVDWDYVVDDGLLVPNTRDKETILSLARMAANAYNSIDGDEWEDLGEPWKNKTAIGWESDGLRGHVFATQDNKTLVLSIKGTSASLFLVGRGPTSVKDKFNDNRMFSCCCARVDYSWSTVCDCYMGSNQCDERCLQNSMSIAEDLYFYTAAMLIMDLTNRYPDSQIVLTGHSLGGSLAALMGLSFGLPVVAFEAPGDLLAAKRLHLPMPPAIDFATLPIYHVGHDADPIFTGTCTGASSSCYYAGYALETKCHLGNSCMLGVAEKLNWRLDIRHHRITEVIEHVLLPWDRITNSTSLPECKPEVDCVDCGLWQYV